LQGFKPEVIDDQEVDRGQLGKVAVVVLHIILA
jgi:hypothetical protein